MLHLIRTCFSIVLKAIYYCVKGMYCPVCERSSREFIPINNRKNVKCPICGSRERHRFLYFFLLNIYLTPPLPSVKVLHIAPEVCLAQKLKEKFGKGYLSAGLSDRDVMVEMDITNIKYPDRSFDLIICSHVLEHIQDDKKAISELYRVLKDNSMAIILFPISTQKTFEDPSITDPEERFTTFGQHNYVRICGKDYIDRIRDAGFHVETVTQDILFSDTEIIKFGIPKGTRIFLAQK